jgi:hypothetical protein
MGSFTMKSKINPKTGQFFCIIFFFVSIYTEKTDAGINDHLRYNAAIFDEGTIIPFYSGFASLPIHPGLLVGTEYYYHRSMRNQLFQTLNLGGYFHEGFEHGLFINTDVGYRHVIPCGIMGDILLGIGYLHTFSDNDVFKQDKNGQYVKIADYGNPRFTADASVGLGYDFAMKTKLSIQPYVRYQFFIEMPWAKGLDNLLMAHTVLQVGCIFPLTFGARQRTL